ncbi:MAG: hypothetical protein KGI06_04355 [Candidatus Micrarchaeota archaeon]|nr:hypothetical protein [Candidatus Micrarchaeota archaeon]
MAENTSAERDASRDISAIEAAIEKAVLFLPGNFLPRHLHSERCYNVLRHILYKDEYTVIEAKQSLLKSFAPMRVLATNQRVIVVKPSFWSLWTGHNVFSPTKYESIPYSNIINITLYTGMKFSSLYIHMNTGASNGEGEVDGLKTDDARAIFTFLEKMTEYLRGDVKESKESIASQMNIGYGNVDSNFVDMETSRRLIKYTGSKFIWLGREPLEYVADKLDIDGSAILAVNPNDFVHMDKQKFSKLRGSILVCNNGNFSAYMSRFLKDVHDTDTYVLSGGIEYQAKRIFDISKMGIKSPAIDSELS